MIARLGNGKLPKAGEMWTDDEVLRMLDHLGRGGSVTELAKLSGRSEDAIRKKAAGRGLLRPRKATLISRRAKRATEFLS